MSDKKKLLPIPETICPETEQAFYNCRLKIITDENGKKRCIQRLFSEKAVFPPPGYVKRREAPAEARKVRLLREELREMSGAELAAIAARDDPARAYEVARREMEAEYASNRTEWALDHSERRPEDVQRSARRARGRVMDYVMADRDLTYFITLTLSGEDFARDDLNTAFKKLRVWLNNRVQRSGLKYVMVPEFHKDGKAVHFHGFINDVLRREDSGTVIPPDGGRPIKRTTAKRKGYALSECHTVYNLPEWGYGYTTAVALYGERLAAARYAAKYVTKEVKHAGGDAGKIGGRWYWSSNNLTLPELIYCYDDFDAAEGYTFETPAGRMKVQTDNTEVCNTDRIERQGGGVFWAELQKTGKTH